MNEPNGTPLDTYERRVRELEEEIKRLKDDGDGQPPGAWARLVAQLEAKQTSSAAHLQKEFVGMEEIGLFAVLAEYSLGFALRWLENEECITSAQHVRDALRAIYVIRALTGGDDANDD